MFEYQHIKIKHVMYAPKRFECCLWLPDMFKACSKLPCRKTRCSAKIKDVHCSTFMVVIIEQKLLECYNEILKPDSNVITYGKPKLCLDKICITYDKKVTIY